MYSNLYDMFDILAWRLQVDVDLWCGVKSCCSDITLFSRHTVFHLWSTLNLSKREDKVLLMSTVIIITLMQDNHAVWKPESGISNSGFNKSKSNICIMQHNNSMTNKVYYLYSLSVMTISSRPQSLKLLSGRYCWIQKGILLP